jgi:hypothetical protein
MATPTEEAAAGPSGTSLFFEIDWQFVDVIKRPHKQHNDNSLAIVTK